MTYERRPVLISTLGSCRFPFASLIGEMVNAARTFATTEKSYVSLVKRMSE
jgi:hypothetical protein